MEKRDYYEVLGISKGASQKDIKMAFKQLARKYHPDVAEDKEEAEVKFREINEAYGVLSDEEKRSMYDQFGHQAVSGAAGGGYPYGGGFSDFGGVGGFGDIFDLFESLGGMGGGRRGGRRSRASRGRDVPFQVDITLEEAFRGKQVTIEPEIIQTCPVCNGRRAKPGTELKNCVKCQGTGVITKVSQMGFMSFQSQSPCDACHGMGQIPEENCEECHGIGKTKTKRKITVNIPPGVDTGSRMRIDGEGEAGEFGGPPGDLYVIFSIENDDRFKRHGKDLYTELKIGFADAALGAEKEIETFDGPEKIEIKEGTQTGTVKTLKGKGMPDLRKNRHPGDIHVTIKVVTPTKLTARQKELLCEFAEEGPQFHCEKKGFFGKIIDAIKGKG